MGAASFCSPSRWRWPRGGGPGLAGAKADGPGNDWPSAPLERGQARRGRGPGSRVRFVAVTRCCDKILCPPCFVPHRLRVCSAGMGPCGLWPHRSCPEPVVCVNVCQSVPFFQATASLVAGRCVEKEDTRHRHNKNSSRVIVKEGNEGHSNIETSKNSLNKTRKKGK